jgi:hypothetical protein
MEILTAIISALLSATGIFASTGVIELAKKYFRQVRQRRESDILLEEEKTLWTTTDSASPKIPSVDSGRTPARRDSSDNWRIGGAPRQRSMRPQAGLFVAFLLVVCVFAIAIGVIWALTHIGGPVEAGVKTTIEKAGGSILIVGTGLFGAFFAVSLLAFAAIHVFSKRPDD